VLLTLPFDMRDRDAVPFVIRDAIPFVIRDAETLPFVILLPLAPVEGAIMRLPSPRPRSSSGKM
jgi:hypothetical protein